MDRENYQKLIDAAERELAAVRGSLLIAAQSVEKPDLTAVARGLDALCNAAGGAVEISTLIDDCRTALDAIDGQPDTIYRALDRVSAIEAAILDIPLSSGEFLNDIESLIDASFGSIETAETESCASVETFEIDEETLEIFTAEARGLLAGIGGCLGRLSSSPGDQNVVWKIRRSVHTLKGTAGIVGLGEACRIAHRMEDLLDRMVDIGGEVSPAVLDLLSSTTSALELIVAGQTFNDSTGLDDRYARLMSSIVSTRPESSPQSVSGSPSVNSEVEKNLPAPIVRISLDRLDELIKLSLSLLINRSALAEAVESGDVSKLHTILGAQHTLTNEIHSQLQRIRMVKFATLETRLGRAVTGTCVDENKKAMVDIKGGETEIDTQLLDVLIEPLLHLLKNAVVHGIEPPATRRLIGKPERGKVSISVEATRNAVTISVADDGAGISTLRLRQKAIESGVLSEDQANVLTESETTDLIFHRGLTTASKLDLNAGRGVGMSIVKESIESRGGTITIDSESQRGTTFTIQSPLVVPSREKSETRPSNGVEANALVLVVDDSDSVRRHNARLVEDANLRVITASDGSEALELLLSGTVEPDLILSDVEMPQIDGWTLLEYLKMDDNLGHIPVVMVTSLDSDRHRQRAIDLGASDYIVKPLTAENFEAAMSSATAVTI